MIKLIIAGSRDFFNYNLMEKEIDLFLRENNYNEVEIVSGAAMGADKLGELYAKRKGFPLKKFPADWDKYGKSAGYIRNNQMAEYADASIIFWNGKSKGSKHMIDKSKSKNILIKIIYF